MADPPSLAESFASTSLSLFKHKKHDSEAWQRLVKLYSPLVYHWCRSARLRPQDAADLLQEVFQAVAAALGTFRHDEPGHTFRGWLRTIVQHKLCDYFRDRKRVPDAAGGSDAQRYLVGLPEHRSAVDESAVELAERRLLLRRDLQLVHAEFEETTWQAFAHDHRRATAGQRRRGPGHFSKRRLFGQVSRAQPSAVGFGAGTV